MSKFSALQKSFFKSAVYSLLAFFLIPLVTLLFINYADHKNDLNYEKKVLSLSQLSDAQKQTQIDFIRANPPSKLCKTTDPSLENLRDRLCKTFDERWQFMFFKDLAIFTLMGGCTVFLLLFGLSLTAFTSRSIQYWSFSLGWHLLTITAALEIIIQGGMLIWLSFWMTAVFTKLYFPKLILGAAMIVAIGMFAVISGMFRKLPEDNEITGELVAPDDAPKLWARVMSLAKHMRTKPPRHIIAGIDANFFVTETPLKVDGKEIKGRTLYISLPLLRILNTKEANAIMAHELMHMKAGDTANSAALGPKLSKFERYREMLASNTATIFLFYVFTLYRMFFELALQRESRREEFRADKMAARIISPKAVVCSLVKVQAFANYQSDVEGDLFDKNHKHAGKLGILESILSGLTKYVSSRGFLDDIRDGAIPHPFDSHPSFYERVKNVGLNIKESDLPKIAISKPERSWIDEIPTASEIERRLWGEYEEDFAKIHERSLAYRYKPTNLEEAEVVEKYFPRKTFKFKNGSAIEINFSSIITPEKEEIPWDQVASIEYEEGTLSDELTIIHPDSIIHKKKSTKIKLPSFKNRREEFNLVFCTYWERHQLMREYQSEPH